MHLHRGPFLERWSPPVQCARVFFRPGCLSVRGRASLLPAWALVTAVRGQGLAQWKRMRREVRQEG